MKADPANFDRLLHQAGLILQKTANDSVVLSRPEIIKDSRRNLVMRCQVEAAPSGISSVVIKQIKEEAVRGFSDWASIAFLSEVREARGIVPLFYGGDISNRFFLMEDLGPGSTLQNILTGTDPLAARAALRILATQMGRLHAVTVGNQDRFETIRAALPETDGLGHQAEARNWLDNREKLADWFKALDCVMSSGFDECLKHIFDAYCHPEEFLAFTHGDPAPSNSHFANDQAHLLDFEYGGFRHALYDITAWNILCPLPKDCVREMNFFFREELAKTFPAARDEARFAQEWACLCAYRALAMLTWIPPDVMKRNRPWADHWTMREAVFVAISRLKEVTAPFAQLEAVSEAAEILKTSLRKHGPEFENAEDLLPSWSGLKKIP